jgi:hypothetical protein
MIFVTPRFENLYFGMAHAVFGPYSFFWGDFLVLVGGENPYSAKLFAGMGPGILAALQNATKRVKAGEADAAVNRWFGYTPDAAGRTELGNLLGQLTSRFHFKDITVGFMGLKQRVGDQNARAWNIGKPQLKLGTDLAGPNVEAGGISTIELDINFKKLPDYMPTVDGGSVDATKGHQSKFGTLIHELTHVLLGTRDVEDEDGDVAYGAQAAEALARSDTAGARANAENWGIFIEACGRNGSS